MRSYEELKKTFEVFSSDNDIINIVYKEAVLNAEENIRHSELVKEEVLKILENGNSDSYKVIIDNSPIGNKGIAPHESRKKYLNLFSNEKIKKAAIVGGSIYLRTIGNLLAGFVFNSKQLKFFSEKDKAIKWLKDD